jgi:hypothetical protein
MLLCLRDTCVCQNQSLRPSHALRPAARRSGEPGGGAPGRHGRPAAAGRRARPAGRADHARGRHGAAAVLRARQTAEPDGFCACVAVVKGQTLPCTRAPCHGMWAEHGTGDTSMTLGTQCESQSRHAPCGEAGPRAHGARAGASGRRGGTGPAAAAAGQPDVRAEQPRWVPLWAQTKSMVFAASAARRWRTSSAWQLTSRACVRHACMLSIWLHAAHGRQAPARRSGSGCATGVQLRVGPRAALRCGAQALT